MNKKSENPWLRYSLKDGSVLEISMQDKPEIHDSEGMLPIDKETAIGFLSGTINPSTYFVPIDDPMLLLKAEGRYARTSWYLEEITDDRGSLEVIHRYNDGMVLRRHDSSSTSMMLYVTKEQDPSILLSRHLLASGGSTQTISFNIDVGYSVYVRQHVV